MRQVSLSWHYLVILLKTRLAYRADFLVQVGSDLLLQAVDIVFLSMLFSRVDALAGWRFAEVLFIYGFFLIPFALFNASFAALSAVGGRYVVQGELDRVLVRPVSALLQVQLELVRPQTLNGVVLGVIILGISSQQLGITWTFAAIFATLAGILGAWLLYGGLYIAIASLSFWTQDRVGLFPIAYNLINFGRYPLTVYPLFIRFLLTFVLPYGFLAFYPAAGVLRPAYQTVGLLTLPVGGVWFMFSLVLWRRGLARYEGAGS